MDVFLGIDTSCYTSSIAVADENENILINIKKQLAVEKGHRGLRQSDGVFQHIKNLPDIFSQTIACKDIRCVAASTRPRPQPGSYMPVFVAADSFGRTIAQAKDAAYIASTHQHAHIYAAMIGKSLESGDYIALHVSGGTTEVLKITLANGFVENISLIGGTLDITAGQLIDRIGVKIGLDFPSGAQMEKLAKASQDHMPFKLPVRVSGCGANLSGAEAWALKAADNGMEKAQICRSVFGCVCATLTGLIKNACEKEGIRRAILFGGVCSSEIIKEYITEELKEIQTFFADKEYAGDNAAGLAILAKREYFQGKK